MAKQLVFITAFFLLSTGMQAQSKYALLIGINDYYEVKGTKSEVSLHGSVNDANAIRNLLIKKFAFKSSNIDTIYNAAATRDNIIAGLKKKLSQCRPGDAMVFYYSGHGVYMYNSAEYHDPVKDSMSQAMLTSDLYNYDDHLKCFFRDVTLKQYFNLFIDKKVILTSIFDCCFGGNLAMASQGSDFSEQVRSVDLKALFGRLTANAANMQLLMDSINGGLSTPPGCVMDSSGKLQDNADADGDGVPDCRDKEKFTAKDCFPVDQDGVGSCNFDYLMQQAQTTQQKYDSAELVATHTNAVEGSRSFAVGAVLRISEKDSIQRPVDRKNSKFLFLSATTDVQQASEFPDSNHVVHGLFTASLLRAYAKYPASTSIESIFKKITDDMARYHKLQNPTKRDDPVREKANLLGVKLQRAK